MTFITIVILYFILFPVGYSCIRWRDKVRNIKYGYSDTSFTIAVWCPPFAIVYGLTEVFLTKIGILESHEERNKRN